MKLTELLDEKLIAVPLAATNKAQALASLVDLIHGAGLAISRADLLSAVLAREAQRTTGIGHGFAIPHAKCDTVSRLTLVFGRPAVPIDFDAVDGKPVSLIALIVSPTTQTGPHLQALAALSRMVTHDAAFAELVSAAGPAEFAAIIRRLEQ